jgi:hypothetical protein
MHVDGLEHKELAASSSFTVSSDIQLLAILGETPSPPSSLVSLPRERSGVRHACPVYACKGPLDIAGDIQAFQLALPSSHRLSS